MHLNSKKPWAMFALLFSVGFVIQPASGLDHAELIKLVAQDRARRYEVFRDFHIRGVCGTTRLKLAVAHGANTIRTYVPPSRAKLDEYQRLGVKVVVGIWMPNHGENKGKQGVTYNYDYHKKADEQLASFLRAFERIGNHPAILLWCFGNEVELSPPYLETVNRMSKALHAKNPTQLSSLTIVNASSEKIALIKKHAPDIDIIGYNSYGHGAVGGASKRLEKEWRRAYYVSEFGPQGPWWGRKTSWGAYYEQSYDTKLKDLRQSFLKIDAAPRCLGSTMFLWGFWSKQKPTYFSAFLSPQGTRSDDEGALYITPMVDEFAKYWSGSYPAKRAPILQSIVFDSSDAQADVVLTTGRRFRVTAQATDSDTPHSQLTYRWWILDSRGRALGASVDTKKPQVELEAPDSIMEGYFLMAFVIAPDQRASGFTVPFMVKPQPANDPR